MPATGTLSVSVILGVLKSTVKFANVSLLVLLDVSVTVNITLPK